MTIYKKDITLTYAENNLIQKYLSGKEYLSEDNTISFTADFGEGMEMDIKVCGVQYQEEEDNSAWTEAVLFKNGSEVSHTDVCDEILGEWICEDHDGNQYVVNVKVSEPNDEKIEIQTSAGILRAYKSADPGQPGICVVFQPKGFDCEVDLSFVSVYQDPEYQTRDKEGTEDVCIMTYANIFDEDYTAKDIIRRADIERALTDVE